jgi:hypothetical protein
MHNLHASNLESPRRELHHLNEHDIGHFPYEVLTGSSPILLAVFWRRRLVHRHFWGLCQSFQAQFRLAAKLGGRRYLAPAVSGY